MNIGSKVMDEETLEVIRQKHELCVIAYREAQKTVESARASLELAESNYKKAKEVLGISLDEMTDSRKQYETALYEFWEINNE
jgi:hypothetical protein